MERRARKKAQPVKALANKLDDLSPVPGAHMIEGEMQLYKLSSDLHMYDMEGHAPLLINTKSENAITSHRRRFWTRNVWVRKTMSNGSHE